MGKRLVVTSRTAAESRGERRARERDLKELLASVEEKPVKQNLLQDAFPPSKMPKGGWRRPHTMRGPVRVTPPAHRASSRILAAAYPFLTESGQMMRGPYIGENMLSRSPFCFDPWEAYEAGDIKSHSAAIVGVKGVGKSFLAKSWSTRLIRMGRCVAVPHDPNSEWGRVAEYVGGRTIQLAIGSGVRINFFDPGTPEEGMSAADWASFVLQDRRAMVRTIVSQLRHTMDVPDEEHTAIDLALQTLDQHDTITVSAVYQALRGLEVGDDEQDVKAGAVRLAHTLRRLVAGDLAGMFDGPSTVTFDATAPMMVVDTSRLKNTSPEMQTLARLATARWVRNATTGPNKRPRVIVHEEAAIALMNDVYGGAGLKDRVADEKVARHHGASNWYLLHRIADLDALGDTGSAMQTQALGLLADCETRISYQQHPGELERSQRVLGWNETMRHIVRGLKKGEGLWQVGPDRVALVKNNMTAGEFAVFRTDAAGGVQ